MLEKARRLRTLATLIVAAGASTAWALFLQACSGSDSTTTPPADTGVVDSAKADVVTDGLDAADVPASDVTGDADAMAEAEADALDDARDSGLDTLPAE